MIQQIYAPEKNIFNRGLSYRVSLVIATVLPLCIMRFIARAAAILWYYIDRNTRFHVQKNLFRIIGNDPVQLPRTSRKLFINYGTYLADWAKFISLDASHVFSFFEKIEGEDAFRQVHAKNKGVIVLSAHLGNWELGGLVFAHLGIPFNVLTAKDEIEAVAQVRTKIRTLHNIKTITIEDSTLFFIDIVNALKRNEIVAMLVDRYEKENGVLVDFFGEKTYFPGGPVLLARATGALIIPAFTVLKPDGKYKSIVGPVIDMQWSEDRDKDILLNTAKVAHIFEQYIRLYPDQWFNFSAIWQVKR
jgi:KDO2-lipid IV(A) lauroyltransferase